MWNDIIGERDLKNEIKECIKKATSFRIGSRGICVDCWSVYGGTWEVKIPRANVEVKCDYIEVVEQRLVGYACDDETAIQCLTVFLVDYDKVTRLLEVVKE